MWLVDYLLFYFEKFCVDIIKCGPIPRHVAFIMDGNRRYALKTRLGKSEGHAKGSNKLAETLQWCLRLGIPEVTVYAFSIENFKRSKEEVDILMALAVENFRQLLGEKEKLSYVGICIRVIGNLSLLPEELQRLVAEAVLATKDNKTGILNIAFAYTSRDEITSAAETIVDGVQRRSISVDDISEDLISDCLYTYASPDPEVIIRTSGELRFSDFLLWQIANSYIHFAEVLWPEFSIWHLLIGIFKYQRCYKELNRFHALQKAKRNFNTEKFLREMQQQRMTQLRSYLE